MNNTSNPKKQSVKFTGELTYDWRRDTIHVISKDPTFTPNSFHLSLKSGTPTEQEARRVLTEQGVIRQKPLPELKSLVADGILTISTAYELIKILDNPENNVLIGSRTAGGKSFLAYALANEMINQGHKTLFSASELDYPLTQKDVIVDNSRVVATALTQNPKYVFIDEIRAYDHIEDIALIKDKTVVIATAHSPSIDFSLDRIENIAYNNTTNSIYDVRSIFTHVVHIDWREKVCEVKAVKS